MDSKKLANYAQSAKKTARTSVSCFQTAELTIAGIFKSVFS